MFIRGSEEEEVHQSLDELQGLCLEREGHREWLKMENYIAVLIRLLTCKNREIRMRVLHILCLLAKDNAENKVLCKSFSWLTMYVFRLKLKKKVFDFFAL